MDVETVRKMNDMKNDFSSALWRNEIVPLLLKLTTVGGQPSSSMSVAICAIEDILARMMACHADDFQQVPATDEEADRFFDEAHDVLRDCVRNFMSKKFPNNYAVHNVRLDDEPPGDVS